MNKGLVAQTSVKIDAPVARVWDALINPQIIKEYMFGSTVVSDWKVGSKITWKGDWKEKPYEDKGTILKMKPESLLQYSHYSPLSGLPDEPLNYNTVTYELTAKKDQTLVSLSQDNNDTQKEADNSKKMWGAMLNELKKAVEKESAPVHAK